MACTFGTLDAALVAFQQGDPHVQNTLPQKLSKKLFKLTRKEAWDLVPDLHQDVVQRIWELLLRHDLTPFDPSRGSVDTYLKHKAKRAAADVRAEFTPPGERTRIYKDDEGKTVSQEAARSLDEPMTSSNGEFFTLADIIPDPVNPIDCFLDQCEAQELLDLADSPPGIDISEPLNLIYHQEFTLTEAASQIDIHRTTLRRRVDRWVDYHSLSLAI